MMNVENNLSGLNGIKIISMNCDSLNLSTTKRDGSLTKFNEKIETILSNGQTSPNYKILELKNQTLELLKII